MGSQSNFLDSTNGSLRRGSAAAAEWSESITQLSAADIAQFEAHLLRLTPDVCRQRFGHVVNAAFLAEYARNGLRDGTVILACTVNGKIRGVAELRPLDSVGHCAEAAFSVEPDWQARGIGSALMMAAVGVARRTRLAGVFICCDGQNRRMQRIAEMAGAALAFEDGECSGRIEVGRIALDSFISAEHPLHAVVMQLH